jgi:hypothetical protein
MMLMLNGCEKWAIFPNHASNQKKGMLTIAQFCEMILGMPPALVTVHNVQHQQTHSL